MPKIDLEQSKLLGFRLLPTDRAIDVDVAAVTGAKIGKPTLSETKERAAENTKTETR